MSLYSSYEGKRVVITGGSSGIGLATARAIVAAGGRVLITGRSATALSAVASELGERARALQADTGDLDAIARVADEAKAWLGQVDLLFLNAGIAAFTPAASETPERWDTIFQTNTRGAFFTAQRFLPLLPPGAAIVFNTSIADELGVHGASAYGASKAALRSLTRTLARELADHGVRVNAVSPGPTKTAIFGRAGGDAAEVEARFAQIAASLPMKRMGTPEEVAAAAIFLGFHATFTTGAELVVDGGLSQL